VKWFRDMSDDAKFMVCWFGVVALLVVCMTLKEIVQAIYAPETLK
jgi:hypothetical protein